MIYDSLFDFLNLFFIFLCIFYIRFVPLPQAAISFNLYLRLTQINAFYFISV